MSPTDSTGSTYFHIFYFLLFLTYLYVGFPIYDHYSHFDTILILHNKMGGSQDRVAQVDPDISHASSDADDIILEA